MNNYMTFKSTHKSNNYILIFNHFRLFKKNNSTFILQVLLKTAASTSCLKISMSYTNLTFFKVIFKKHSI